jgi:hypothetical protein
VGLADAQAEIIDHAAKKSLIVLNVGNPYLLRQLEPSVRIDTFSSCSASLAASIEALASSVAARV